MALRVLTQSETENIQQADRSFVVSALSFFFANAPKSWQPLYGKYQKGITFQHSPSGNSPIPANQVAQFLAMSAPTHCANGWAFLSRAFNSILSGDAHSAWHFAYYAELRAAQSILAANGCGVFNSWNCVVDSYGKLIQVDDRKQKRIFGTHDMTWMAIKALLEAPRLSSHNVINGIVLGGNTIGELVQAAFPGTPIWNNIYAWLNSWLFDLEEGSNDRAMRNRCSYNPHELTTHSLSVGEGIEFIDEFWKLFTPVPGSIFFNLDKYLLREALFSEAEKSLHGDGVTNPSIKEKIARLENAFTLLKSSYPTISINKDFVLKKQSASNPLILKEAKNRKLFPSSPLPILARASLFLRLANGVVMNLLEDAGVNMAEQLDFWLHEKACERGFINSAMKLSSWSDLFMDVQNSMDDLLEHVNSLDPLEREYILSRSPIYRVCEAERIIFWSLAA